MFFRYHNFDKRIGSKNKSNLWNESDVETRVVGGGLHEPVDEEALVVNY